MADAQTVPAARTDFAAAAEWNQDMGKWWDLWRKLGIARAPIPAPMQKLVAMFLSGEGAHLRFCLKLRDAATSRAAFCMWVHHVSHEGCELMLALVRRHYWEQECAKYARYACRDSLVLA